MNEALYTPRCSVCQRPYSEGPCRGHPSVQTQAPASTLPTPQTNAAPVRLREVTLQRSPSTAPRPLNRAQRRKNEHQKKRR